MSGECGLCGGYGGPVTVVGGREYRRCRNCGYMFMESRFRPDPAAERERYLLHENSPDDPGYRRWLEKFLGFALGDWIEPGEPVLDFGSGPIPVLAGLLENRGFTVEKEDPFFAPGRPRGPFRLVTAVEVFEHLADPLESLRSIRKRLADGGRLAISTEFLPDDREAVAGWHYMSDPTHIGFFTPDSLTRAAEFCDLRRIECDGVRYIAFETTPC